MSEISFRAVGKTYDGFTYPLRDLSFDVYKGEHVALLGENGSGKSTVLKLISGALSPDEGEIFISRQSSVAVLTQIPNFPADFSTEDVLKDAQRELFEAETRLRELEKQMANCKDGSVLAEYDRLSENFRLSGGYEKDAERARVAFGLQIDDEMREKRFSSLSGGEKTRVCLAALVLKEPDILLLDEPTNHLDTPACEWLEERVRSFKGTVLTVSHDRYFLDKTADRCIVLEEGKAEFYAGNYSFYLEESLRREKAALESYEKDLKDAKKLLESAEMLHIWGNKGKGRLHKRAFSMEKKAAELMPEKRPQQKLKFGSRFKSTSYTGDTLFDIRHIKMAFGERELFEIRDTLLRAEERVALIGPNGSGKTTLIKILLRELKAPVNRFIRGDSLKTAYLPQEISFSDESENILDCYIGLLKQTPAQARNTLARFGFRGEGVFKSIASLSGGEKTRLKLSLIMQGDANLLILDEPTNHLDLKSREWIEEALAEYTGAMLLVSHDRYFASKFAERIWEIRDGIFTDYRGSYEEFTEFKQRMRSIGGVQTASSAEKPKKDRPLREKSDRKTAGDIKKLEKEIDSLENMLSELEALEERESSNYIKLMEIHEEKAALEETLNTLYDDWEEAHE